MASQLSGNIVEQKSQRGRRKTDGRYRHRPIISMLIKYVNKKYTLMCLTKPQGSALGRKRHLIQQGYTRLPDCQREGKGSTSSLCKATVLAQQKRAEQWVRRNS